MLKYNRVIIMKFLFKIFNGFSFIKVFIYICIYFGKINSCVGFN